jgi:hypothetical protein
MKTASFVYRNIYMIFITALLMNGVVSYSQQTGEQKTTFGFHTGFYFPEQQMHLYQISGDTCKDILHDYDRETAISKTYLYFMGREIMLDDSSNMKFKDPLCRIPEYSRSELNAMHKQQDLMREQYYNTWLKQDFYERYSVDIEGIVRGFK